DALALSLKWDAVTIDVDGQPLSPGNQVTSYKIYRCPSNSCTLSTATFVSSVTAPIVTFNIDSQPKPSTYFVTAVNISAESKEGNTVRVTPADRPVNLTIVNP